MTQSFAGQHCKSVTDSSRDSGCAIVSYSRGLAVLTGEHFYVYFRYLTHAHDWVIMEVILIDNSVR